MIVSQAQSAERGFTFLEVLIGLAVTTAIALVALGTIHAFTRALSTSYASSNGGAGFDQMLTDMREQATTSLAVFVPAKDVFGNPNTTSGARPHEVDYYSKTSDGAPIFSAYRYDAEAKTLQRYDYDGVGHRGIRSATTGSIEPNAAYPKLTNVAAFDVQAFMAPALATAANPFHAALPPQAASKLVGLPVSMNNDGLNRPDAYGGNTIVQVHATRGSTDRTIHLAAGAFPSGFTYEGGPKWHAILWRTDATVKRFFGTRSYVYIWADVDVTYDDWKTYHVWCHQIGIYGNPKGLRKGDPREDYLPRDPAEQANFVLDRCIHGTGAPGDNNYYPPHLIPPNDDAGTALVYP